MKEDAAPFKKPTQGTPQVFILLTCKVVVSIEAVKQFPERFFSQYPVHTDLITNLDCVMTLLLVYLWLSMHSMDYSDVNPSNCITKNLNETESLHHRENLNQIESRNGGSNDEANDEREAIGDYSDAREIS